MLVIRLRRLVSLVQKVMASVVLPYWREKPPGAQLSLHALLTHLFMWCTSCHKMHWKKFKEGGHNQRWNASLERLSFPD